MKYYNNSEELDIDIWTVDYLTALDDFDSGKISKEEKERIEATILRDCITKYGNYDKLLSAVFGE